MIFVAVGTTDFDALLQSMDELTSSLPEKVIMQIGRGKYVPKHCEYFRFAPSLTPYYEQASLVVSHGGLGIVTEVMTLGLPLIAVEDPAQPDRHQRQILCVWEKERHLIWCKDLHKLPQAINHAKEREFEPYTPPQTWIHTVISGFLESLEHGRKAG
jgi:UDP-N-acetylglucosamine transferase subunit ALG13